MKQKIFKKNKRSVLWRRIKRNRQIYLLLLPVLVFLIVYSYVPMYGITLAWKDYYRSKGILGSPWVGWENFELMFSMPQFARAVKNTLIISVVKLLVTFPLPIILALLINEVRSKSYRRVVQTFTYLPHFISWVIIGGLVKNFLSYENGAVNNLLASMGVDRVAFLNEPAYFIPILLFAEIWKGVGWGSIIYLSSMTGIDPNLYEAAQLDGCGRFRSVFYITLPSIMPTVSVMLVLAIAGIMNAGFDPIYNLYNPATYSVADIIDTLSFRLFKEDQNWELSAAVGLFKTTINFILMIFGNYATKKMTGYSMYSFDA